MGWKEGQGIGAKVTLRQRRAQQQHKKKANKAARPHPGKNGEQEDEQDDDASDDDDGAHNLLLRSKVAPEDVVITDFTAHAKMDRHGLGFDAVKNAPDVACKLPSPTHALQCSWCSFMELLLI